MKSKKKQILQRPESPTHMGINLVGLVCTVFCIWLIRNFGGDLSLLHTSILLLLSLALPIVFLESIFLKSFLRSSTGIDWKSDKSWNYKRVLIKYVGFLETLGLCALLYWMLPEYQGSFYDSYYEFLDLALPPLLILAIPYFMLVDRYQVEPEDGYWHLCMASLFQFERVDRNLLVQHLLGWLVKTFFLALMFTYFTRKVHYFRAVDPLVLLTSYKGIYDFFYQVVYGIDLLFVTVGYIMTLKLLDSHIRTTEPTFLGWFVCLECYQPFWSFSSKNYLAYSDKTSWGYWFGNDILFPVWALMILILIGIYVWATIPFGIRFSNLTNRGIFTNGPYRYTKHPAYVSKNISWWLISMPYYSLDGTPEAIRHCLLLLCVNLIYFLRARTEERHLSKDPDYIAYAEYIEKHGIFSWLGWLIPILKFKPGKMLNL